MNKDFFKDIFKPFKQIEPVKVGNDFDLSTTASSASHYLLLVIDNDRKEVFRVDESGRIFWRGREVETDSEFRNSMMGLKNSLDGMFTLEVK